MPVNKIGDGLLERSFADAIAAIEQAKELPASKRTHWCCSLRIIAKALAHLIQLHFGLH
jgi:hypothetical protein